MTNRNSRITAILTTLLVAACAPPGDEDDSYAARAEEPGELHKTSSALVVAAHNASTTDHVTGTSDLEFELGFVDGPNATPVNLKVSTMVSSATSAPATPGSSCSPGVDYLAFTDKPITLPAGEDRLSVHVTVCGDNLVESRETLYLRVQEAQTGLCSGELCLAIGEIVDLPSVSVNDLTVGEPTSGAAPATFTLSLSQAVPYEVSVLTTVTDLETTSAGLPGDCNRKPSPDILTQRVRRVIPAGQLSTTYGVMVCADSTRERGERFHVKLSSPVNTFIADDTGVGIISEGAVVAPHWLL
ncbi:MAG: hypothetical protein RLZZ450_4151 [Pseudomonadota bacterium]|jgi:hypothetical protein